MRRAAKEITNRRELEDVLARAEVVFLALRDDPAPYVLPMNAAWADGALWFHGAPAGRRRDLVDRDARVGFAAVVDARVVPAATACGFTATGRSVVGHGTLRVCTDEAERRRGLDAIMRRHGMERPAYDAGALGRTAVLRLDVEELRGKRLA
jgi:hypothetical protein